MLVTCQISHALLNISFDLLGPVSALHFFYIILCFLEPHHVPIWLHGVTCVAGTTESTPATTTVPAFPLCDEPSQEFNDNLNFDIEGLAGRSDNIWLRPGDDLSCLRRISSSDNRIRIVPVFRPDDVNAIFDLTGLRFIVKNVNEVELVLRKRVGRRLSFTVSINLLVCSIRIYNNRQVGNECGLYTGGVI